MLQFNLIISLKLNSYKVGEKLINMEALSKIQLKTFSEIRKNVLAMNDICNPKRTTFIKEANQYNKLEVNQKKLELKKELQTQKELLPNKSIEDAEIIPSKDCIKC
jgi:uncharacterized protein (DUF1015 family)